MDSIDKYMLLIPAAPLAAAVLCAVVGPWLSKRIPQVTAWITAGAIAISFAASLLLFMGIRQHQAEDSADATFHRVQELWTWADIQEAQVIAPEFYDFRVAVALRADPLSSMMLCMVTFVATLVAVFGMGYMKGDRSYWRFFAYVSLFVFSMTMLISVSNFVMLFVFWEAVGVCSYLLIGFWYTKPEAAAAGMKAFLVNRVGDFGFALALFLIWVTYGTLDYHSSVVTVVDGEEIVTPIDSVNTHELTVSSAAGLDSSAAGLNSSAAGLNEIRLGVLDRPADQFETGWISLAICLLLMLGACGKSAQFPLHVWLPDAMEGPTPVSALIHAATMVTAGVYMVTRCTPLFVVSPDAQLVVACVGGFTALLAGLIAITQFDLKRVLAYSTVSQLGYMFVGLGVGTFAGITAGMFHLFTHAFFKALLFLGSGSVMHSMGHVIDMRRFGGLKRIMPITCVTFAIGCIALSGVFPFAGFWSKDAIIGALHEKAHVMEHTLHAAHENGHGDEGPEGVATAKAAAEALESGYTLLPAESAITVYWVLYYAALFTAFLTAFYTFRAFFMTFFGEERVPAEAGEHAHESPLSMTIPLMGLAVMAFLAGGGFWGLSFGHQLFEFLGQTPSLSTMYVGSHEVAFHVDVAIISNLVAFAGIGMAAYLYLGGSREASGLARMLNAPWYQQLFDVNRMSQLQNVGWIRKTRQHAEAMHLGWLAVLVGRLLLLLALIISAPLILLSFASPYRLSQNKFFVDELYQFFLVKPLQLFAKLCYAIDRGAVDGLVNLVGRTPVIFGNLMRSLQMGLTPFYALSMILGTVLLILVRLLWLPS
jgi:NADH-quinone oxidoreductase subunit L